MFLTPLLSVWKETHMSEYPSTSEMQKYEPEKNCLWKLFFINKKLP